MKRDELKTVNRYITRIVFLLVTSGCDIKGTTNLGVGCSNHPGRANRMTTEQAQARFIVDSFTRGLEARI
jgi:hypothetical protein